MLIKVLVENEGAESAAKGQASRWYPRSMVGPADSMGILFSTRATRNATSLHNSGRVPLQKMRKAHRRKGKIQLHAYIPGIGCQYILIAHHDDG